MSHAQEIEAGRRFQFGDNWRRFLGVLDENRISAAEASLRKVFALDDLRGRAFLDAGSGSGLFSLAARRLGARVRSFDFDPQSVACTRELRQRFFPSDPDWVIEEGSVLDTSFVGALGQFDLVYCYGVLHHTGAMWLGIENLVSRVRPGGLLFVALYADQGWKSHFWWFVKLIYNKLPGLLRRPYGYAVGILALLVNIVKRMLLLKPMSAIRPLLDYDRERGMSVLHDMIDWIGGFPYEFVTYETLEAYLDARGLRLVRGERGDSLGCHAMTFSSRCADPARSRGH